MKISRLAAGCDFGALVSGVDLCLLTEQRAALQRLLWKHGVLVFPRQMIRSAALAAQVRAPEILCTSAFAGGGLNFCYKANCISVWLAGSQRVRQTLASKLQRRCRATLHLERSQRVHTEFSKRQLPP